MNQYWKNALKMIIFLKIFQKLSSWNVFKQIFQKCAPISKNTQQGISKAYFMSFRLKMNKGKYMEKVLNLRYIIPLLNI